MDQSAIPWVLSSLLAAAALSQWARARWLSRRPSVRARARVHRAHRGERTAERLLRRRGYRVVARQPRARWDISIDGEPRRVDLRPDLIVERRDGGARVAEIKTGRIAPRLDHPATRRQLLEYALAFDVQGVLLVDVESGRIQEVSFPIARARRAGAGARCGPLAAPRPIPWLLAGAALGAAACWWWLQGG